MERVFDFTRRVLAAAEREDVMRVLEVPFPFPFQISEGWTWYDCVRERFEKTGTVYLFPSGGGPTDQVGGRFRIPARLAYWKGTKIVEEEVEDPGLLLRSLQRTEDHIGRWSVGPLVLHGSSRTGDDWAPGAPPDRLRICLSLFTDIWFPRVIGLNADDHFGRIPDTIPMHPARSHRDALMDNSALAGRHTPRLNRFIQTLREAILELGGTWKFDRAETSSAYLPMIHEEGILLDYPAANA